MYFLFWQIKRNWFTYTDGITLSIQKFFGKAFFNFEEICGDNACIPFFRTICWKYSYGVKICVHPYIRFLKTVVYQTYILDDVQKMFKNLRSMFWKKKNCCNTLLHNNKKIMTCSFCHKFVLLFPLTKFKLLKHPMPSYICHYRYLVCFDFYLLNS